MVSNLYRWCSPCQPGVRCDVTSAPHSSSHVISGVLVTGKPTKLGHSKSLNHIIPYIYINVYIYIYIYIYTYRNLTYHIIYVSVCARTRQIASRIWSFIPSNDAHPMVAHLGHGAAVTWALGPLPTWLNSKSMIMVRILKKPGEMQWRYKPQEYVYIIYIYMVIYGYTCLCMYM